MDLPFHVYLKDTYYIATIEGKKIVFYYVCHDNILVFDSNNKLQELYLTKNPLLIPVSHCKEISPYFMVYKHHVKLDTNSRLCLNGEIVDKLDPKTNWFDLWVKTQFKAPTGKLEFYPSVSHKIPNHFNFPKNKIIFSRDILKSAPYYDSLLKNKKIIPKGPRSNYNFINMYGKNKFPSKKYNKNVKVVNIHFGQLKLLLSEIDFLSQLPNEPILVLYAGAGPGDHVPLLSQMFENFYFMLVDPVFSGKERIRIIIHPSDRIILRATLFDDKIIDEFKNIPNKVLISDIRSVPAGESDYEKEFEKNVIFDMKLQAEFFEKLYRPFSLLKFRLPYTEKKTEYLDGDLYFQAFPKETSTEMRLIPHRDGRKKTYDNIEVEEKMFYFNTEYRNKTFYDPELGGDPVFGKNYDILLEATIIKKWLIWAKIEASTKNIFNMIGIIDNFFNRKIKITEKIIS